VTASVSPPVSRKRLERARNGVALAFVVAGFGFASFASRTPAVKSGLDLDASGLGLLLVCMSTGAMVSMPFTGAVAHRFGPARGVIAGAVLETSGFLGVALGLSLESAWFTGASLFVTGLGISLWDVAMNVEGAAVERLLRRSIMARFHAGFSLGTVLGAGAGALGAAVGLSLSLQLVVTAGLLVTLATLGALSFTEPSRDRASKRANSRALLVRAWTTPRTIIVGLMVLAFAFTEGVANDWTAVAVVDGLDATDAAGALAFATFVAAMTFGRVVGGSAIDHWGRVVVLRLSAVVAAVGVVGVVVAPALPAAFAGTILWGLGAALGFPTGMSAAADHVDQAAIHVSVVSAIGYTAFLAGPPLVGFLGDHFGVRESLLVVVGALLLAFVAAPAARPLTAAQVAAARASDLGEDRAGA
jgi:MFS family permease